MFAFFYSETKLSTEIRKRTHTYFAAMVVSLFSPMRTTAAQTGECVQMSRVEEKLRGKLFVRKAHFRIQLYCKGFVMTGTILTLCSPATVKLICVIVACRIHMYISRRLRRWTALPATETSTTLTPGAVIPEVCLPLVEVLVLQNTFNRRTRQKQSQRKIAPWPASLRCYQKRERWKWAHEEENKQPCRDP